MHRPVLALALLLLPVAAAGDAIDARTATRIDADVQAVLRQTGAPGAVVAVVERDRIVYRKAYGERDRERHRPATWDTWYEIGSITKQFTAAAVMQLQEAGKLRVDARLATYLPHAPHANEVTLRQLLSHTSGLPEYFDGPDAEQFAVKPATFEQILARIKDKPLDFSPGSRWSYCNTGYLLLGRVIEVVSRETYAHYVKTHLLDAAGMTHTYTVADEARLPTMAVGYRHVDGHLARAPTIHDTVGWSAGNLVSTVEDLERWNRALTGGKIVRADSYAQMATAVTTRDRGSADYGFGLFVDEVDGQPRVGHTGGSFGFTTANEYFPKQDVRVIVFTNLGDNPEAGEMINTAIYERLFPDIAVAAQRSAPGEDAATTATARAVFEQIQHDNGEYSRLSGKLAEKMRTGLSSRLAKNFASYGNPRRWVFKGSHAEGALRHSDYLIRFGPGSLLKFGIGVDAAGKVASLSFG